MHSSRMRTARSLTTSHSIEECAWQGGGHAWQGACVVGGVAFWVTNPCRITRNVKRTKMYVCTLKNIYSSRCSHIAVQVGTEYGTEYALEML